MSRQSRTATTVRGGGSRQPGRFVLRSFGLALALATMAVVDAAFAATASQTFEEFVAELWQDARHSGVSRAAFEEAFFELEPDLSLPDIELRPKRVDGKSDAAVDAPKRPAIGKPGGDRSKAPKPAAADQPAAGAGQAEFVKTAGQYLEPVRLASLTQMGRAFEIHWKSTLDAIEQKSGVSRHVLLAIWGRESIFGTYPLRYNAIRTLATQAYIGRRRAFFRKELIAALRILHEGHVGRDDMMSSWAGAMGLTQFMPTNFERFAVDFDGDGHKNIWTSVPDSLASTAQLLQTATRRSWKLGRSWGYEIRKGRKFDCTLEGVERQRTIREWRKLGAKRTRGRKFRKDLLRERAYLYAPDGGHGPAFLILENFLVIKAYNPPDVYALYVGHLADRIAGGLPFETRWSDVTPLRQPEFKELQRLLTAAGYDIGKADGRGSARMRVAIGRYQRKHRMSVDCYPQANVLAHLRAALNAAPSD